MFVITGITGRVGGVLARQLLSEKKKVRAVVRNSAKGEEWSSRGCDVALADIGDAVALTKAFQGADGVFVMIPPNFDPSPGFPEHRMIVDAITKALRTAQPKKVVYLSTIGAQAKQNSLLTNATLVEEALSELSNQMAMPVTFLRPAWFMENSSWDIGPAKETGVAQSFLQPLDKKVPMVATTDIGRLAAELIQESWDGVRVVELEGPNRVSPNDIGSTLSLLLNRSVRMEVVPRGTWESLFKSQGMKHPGPRMSMLDGFNEEWIRFEKGKEGSRKGATSLETVLKELIGKS